MHEKAISQSIEMYLVTVYRLTEHHETASTNDIADLLDVSLPSVTGQLKRLTEKGYVDYLWREGATLTPVGREIALNVLRKNRLIKTFLHTRAGYAVEELLDEACFMEHVVSDRFADALEEMLDHPTVDPHGLPIPDRSGRIARRNGAHLRAIAPPCDVQVVRIDELNPDAVSHLGRLGLVPPRAARYELRDEDGFLLIVDGRDVTLPRSLADHLLVQEAS